MIDLLSIHLRTPLPFLHSASTAFLQIAIPAGSLTRQCPTHCSSNTGVRIIAGPCNPGGGLTVMDGMRGVLPGPKQTASIQQRIYRGNPPIRSAI